MSSNQYVRGYARAAYENPDEPVEKRLKSALDAIRHMQKRIAELNATVTAIETKRDTPVKLAKHVALLRDQLTKFLASL